MVSSGYTPSSGIGGLYGSFIASFFRHLHTVHHSGCTSLIYHQQCKSFFFSMPFPAFIVCRLFDDGHSDQCEIIPHYSFDLRFSNNEQSWAPFHVFISRLCLLWRNICFRSSAPFLIGLFVFLVLICMSCLYILEINSLSVISFALLLFWGLSFHLIVSFIVQTAFKFN